MLEQPDPGSGARVSRSGGLTFWAETLEITTSATLEFIDITERVATIVRRSAVMQGWVSVFSKHTTAAIVIQENEAGLLLDMQSLLERLSPTQATYGHNASGHRVEADPVDRPNGHAHCQHLLLGSTENIPIADRKMELGRWQRIFLLELDRGRDREVVVQVFGA